MPLLPDGAREDQFFALSHRIASIGALGIAGLAAVGGAYLFGELSLSRIRAEAQSAIAARNTQQDVFTGILKLRQAEKDFLLLKDMHYVEQHKKQSANVAGLLNQLASTIGAMSQDELSQKLAAIRSGYEDYQKHFATRPSGTVPNSARPFKKRLLK